MIVLLGHSSGPKAQAALAGRDNIGFLLSPTHFGVPWTRYYACDNDAFKHRDDPGWWRREGEARWLRMLDKVATLPSLPLFVLLPDVVADWQRTVERAYRYRDELWQRNLPVGLALQDGCDYCEALRLSPSTVFVGGSTQWKWRHAEEITQFFQGCDKRVHIGRTSGPWRIRECLRLGVESCDGTGWFRNPGRELPKLFAALDGQEPQRRLPI
jgi:hypothetical protein